MKKLFARFKNFKHASAKERWKLIGIACLYLAGIFILFVIGVFAYYAKDLPNPNDMGKRMITQSTKIYDRTGTHLLYDIHGEEKRTVIPFSQMPDSLKYATISLEDQNFYTNHGIEITSIIRAGLDDLLHRSASQGASTITQQLVKQTILTPEKTLSRKIKEAILSIEVAQKYSKNDILSMYLNQIPYGSNTYGVEAAAQTYFGKHARDLTLDESAFLAALPQAPSYYSPYGSHTSALIARQHYALNQMAKLGYITQAEADQAKQVDTLAKVKPFSDNISAPHFVMYVRDYLEKAYGSQMLEQGGLKVYTTLDWDMQQAAEQAVKDGSANNLKYGANNAALVAIDPKTGQILAMVGSKDYFGTPEPAGCISGKTCKFEGNFNVATAPRQPGSSFKPYVYLTAFEKGYTPETQLWDVDTNFSTDSGQTYDPKNYDNKNHGLVHMKDALAMSLNVPAVKTEYLAGVQNSIDTAHALGITTLDNPGQYGLSLVLGGGEVTLLDHVNAYASLADDGIHHDKTAILKVVDSTGKVLEQFQNDPGQKVADEKYIGMLDSILSDNSLRAPTFGSNSPLAFTDRPVAAKTGTTNDWRDGWTMGYTPSLAAGVWAGNNDNSPMTAGADGVFTAAPIWREFMNAALKNYPIEQFPKYTPEDAGKDILNGDLQPESKIQVCQIPGSKGDYCLASDACPQSLVENDKFANAHSILYYVNKDDPRGDAPKHPDQDPQFQNWEDAIQKYVKDHKKDYGDLPPTNDCKSSDFANITPDINISSPNDGQTIASSSVPISVSASSPFDIKNISLDISGTNGNPSASPSQDGSSMNYTYTASASGDITIKATATDKNGGTKDASITVHVNIPASPGA